MSRHPICDTLRELRQAAGLSLPEAERISGIPGIVIGSYERGDRTPPITKAEHLLNAFGHTLIAMPKDASAVRVRADMVADLRAIADQLEGLEHVRVTR